MQSWLMGLYLATLPLAAAAAPQTTTHAGRLLGPDGSVLSGTHTLVFELRGAAEAQRWTETHTVTLEDGYYAVLLGTTTPLNPALLQEDLSFVVSLGGTALVDQPMSSAPYALSVDGLVQVSAAVEDCGAGQVGTLRWETDHLEVCNGARWEKVKSSPVGTSFWLRFEQNLIDELGNYTFSGTSQAVYSTAASEGARSMSADVWGSGSTSPYDYAVVSTETDPQWSLHPDVSGDFTLSFDHRHTSDAGWEIIVASNTTSWNTARNTWCMNTGSQATLPSGWAFMVNWGGNYFCFNTSLGAVNWPGIGYHSTWKQIDLIRTGTVLELRVDGVSLGTRTMPGIASSAASLLYLVGSSNGMEPQYNPGSYSLNSQIDDLRFTAD